MSKQFLKVSDVSLQNGGYLSNTEGAPVSNSEFVAAQKRAEYVVTFARLAKGKDFKGKKADSLDELRAEVTKALSQQSVKFVEAPTAPERTLTDNLAAEALKFMDFKAQESKVEKVNQFLQEFTVLHDFETFGLFFESEIVKLNKIYTLEEIKNAVLETIELL